MKTFVVAEIASNWEGSITTAKRLIKESKKSGANAVKFQMWRATDLYEKDHPEWKIIKKSELSFSKVLKLKKYADKIGIELFCSAFYPDAIEFLDSIKVKRHKIASRTCTFKDPYSLETITKISDSRKPVIISMGMGGNKNKIKNILQKNKITFCYCISEYPTDLRKVNWKKLEQYNGFSDHTLGITAPLIFTMIKKQKNAKDIFIEKHVKLKNSKGPDASSSINTDELKTMIEQIRIIENINFN
jgi:sialic acid synthase SpsE